MKRLMEHKRGGMVLRDIVFMMIIFAGVIAFASILVNEMGNEYDNTNMVSDYNQDSIGKDSLTSAGSTWEEIGEDLRGDNGIVKMVTGGLEAIGNILKEVLAAPATFSGMLTSTLDLVGASDETQNMAAVILTGLLYALIIFAIIKVFLKGGEI